MPQRQTFLKKEGHFMKKKLLALLPIMLAPLAVSLTGCSNKTKIGILQYAEFAALDAAKRGFEAGLKEGGLTNFAIDYRNADQKDANMQLFAKDLVDTCALTLGIATPSAKALKAASDEAQYDKPVLFTAVTDAKEAGLVADNENKTGHVCGTIDANPVTEQINLVKEFKSDASKVGILYTQTELNSKVQSDQAEAAIVAAGMTSKVRTCTGPSDVKTTAEALVSDGVDAIYLPTDNNIAKNMNAVKEAAAGKGVLVVCGEEGMLESGGHLTLSIDYYNLGLSTGKMAAQILKGEKAPTDFPVTPVPVTDCSYVFSSTNLTSANLTMPEAMENAHSWKDVNA